VTYSIVARDPETGALGVGVQSHFFGVGAVVPWLEEGLGAVATQAFAEPRYGARVLALLRSGATAPEALAGAVAADGGPAQRQVAVVDAEGRAAAHTGASCIRACGDRQRGPVSVQGNMLVADAAWSSMLEAYEAALADGLPLAERLLVALEAAEANGGDLRGRQAAAVRVVGPGATDLRVDDHADPLGELRRLLALWRGVDVLGQAEALAVAGQLEEAEALFAAAQDAFGANLEPTFWAGALLAALGRPDAAAPSLRSVAADHGGWVELLRRLPASGVVPVTDAQVAAALEAAGLS
jgi:uncharacterized Ntn-hydrolase superfamily protein